MAQAAHQPSVPLWMVETRHYWIELTRIMMGVLIFFKGYTFVQDISGLHVLLEEALPIAPFIVAHYVVFAHLVGGILLVLGLLTRTAALVQIPILLGAVFLVHGSEIFMAGTGEPQYALLILFLLIVFFFYGSGKWSVDHHLMRKEQR